jgi:hypothetical protein
MLEQGGYDQYLRQVRQEYARNEALTVKAVSLLSPRQSRGISHYLLIFCVVSECEID